MSSPITVAAFNTLTLDKTASYQPVVLGAASTTVVTRDAGTPLGDAVVVELGNIDLAAGATLMAENGATLILASVGGLAAASNIEIGPSGSVELASTLSLTIGQAVTFAGAAANLGIRCG